MKLDPEFLLQQVGSQSLLVPIGGAGERFHGVIQLNETAAFLVRCLQQETDEAGMMAALSREYDGTPDQFRRSIEKTVSTLRQAGALIE